MRVDRYLSLASLGMRKEVQQLVRNGVVTVNDEIVTIPDTEGLLLFTNDGLFDHWLMNPNHHIEKRYFFWALGLCQRKNRED